MAGAELHLTFTVTAALEGTSEDIEAGISAAGPPAGSGEAGVVGGDLMFLPASAVAEVARVPAWTRVPNAPAALLGLANLRGTVLPVVSLAVLLGCAQDAASAASRLLVLSGAAPVGVLVNQVVNLGPAGSGRALDVRALLEGAFAGLRHRHATQTSAYSPPAGSQPVIPHPAPGHAAAARGLALASLRVGGQEYALPLPSVVAVLRLPASAAHVRGADAAALGVIAFQGATLPLVSLAGLLGLQSAMGTTTRVVVTTLCGTLLGLVVDAVTGTLSVLSDAIDPVPALLTRGAGGAALDGICRLDGGARLVGLLSPARLFDGETLARLQAASKHEAAPRSEPASPGTLAVATERFVLVRLGGEQYGLPIAALDQVVRPPGTLTWLPLASDFLLGMMGLRGRTVPVIDLGRRFGAMPAERSSRFVVVISDSGLQAGLAVDEVCEVVAVPEAALLPAPAAVSGTAGALFDRVALHYEGQVVLLISPCAVLAQARRDLQQAQDRAAAAPGALASAAPVSAPDPDDASLHVMTAPGSSAAGSAGSEALAFVALASAASASAASASCAA